MIRINLLTHRPTGAPGVSAEDTALTQEIGNIRRRGFGYIFVLFLGPLALYLWEMQSIPQKQKQLAVVQQSLNEAIDKNGKAKDIVTEIKRFKDEQAQLQDQISSVQQLSKNRMREVKILDVIQKEIPEKVWLTKLSIGESKLNIGGNAATDADLISFMEVLSRTAYLKEVNLVKSVEQVVPDIGSVKSFEVTGLLEVGE